MDGWLILFGCWIIADSICFVNGFNSTFYKAKTVEEQEIMRKIKEK